MFIASAAALMPKMCFPNSMQFRYSSRMRSLSIVRSIVEAAGGRVHATNRSACGARVEIELPVRAC